MRAMTMCAAVEEVQEEGRQVSATADRGVATGQKEEVQQQQQPEAQSVPEANRRSRHKRRSRRRRGGRGRWKPYHKLSLEEKIAKDIKEEQNAVRKRERLFSRGKPMAPYNTTQFLLEDREKRVTVDSDGDSAQGIGSHQRRGRSPHERCGIFGQSGSDIGGNTTDTASYSGAEDDEMEREFDADYDYVNLARIGNMSKEEVTREYMNLEKTNSKLADRANMLQLENEKLKQLLKEHNISYDDILPTRRRHSGTGSNDAPRRGSDDDVIASGIQLEKI